MESNKKRLESERQPLELHEGVALEPELPEELLELRETPSDVA